MSPDDDMQVFLAGFETIEDTVEEEGVVDELSLEEAKIAAVEFDPKAFALKVFQPAGPQVSPPVLFDPPADGCFAQVTARLLALNPLVSLGLLLAIYINTALFHGPCPLERPPTH